MFHETIWETIRAVENLLFYFNADCVKKTELKPRSMVNEESVKSTSADECHKTEVINTLGNNNTF